ncbi:Universal stress protein F [Klebsiella pneumoniae subsp. ozaenae]|uniref:Universal stress protein F n=1 Tax=Klebsiella pneumoniae subsp. ozaenae TaxID=574 RepID=A0A377ZRV5_KLEPO|nr:Universal stress protein F [Klebsiella pneumoniae subsp. ozaenae]
MSRMILVPIDISDKEFTERIISHVESEARIDDAEVHFLTVIPSLPYYASLGMAYTAELPGMDELREGSETQLKEIAKQFSIPEDRMHFHVAEGSPKDKILALAKSLPADLVIIASHRPDITTYLLGSNAAAVVRHASARYWWSANAAARRPAGFLFPHQPPPPGCSLPKVPERC